MDVFPVSLFLVLQTGHLKSASEFFLTVSLIDFVQSTITDFMYLVNWSTPNSSMLRTVCATDSPMMSRESNFLRSDTLH